MSLRTRLLVLMLTITAVSIAMVTFVATRTAEQLVLRQVDLSVQLPAFSPQVRRWDAASGQRIGPEPNPSAPLAVGVPGDSGSGPPNVANPTPNSGPPGIGGAATAWVGIGPDGSVASASPAGPSDHPYALPSVAQLRRTDGSYPFGELRTVEADGDPTVHYRAIVQPATNGSVVLVAQPVDKAYSDMARVRLFGLLAALVALAAAGGFGWLGIRRSLQPLGRMQATVGEIAEGDWSRRVEATGPGDEVGRLAESFNVMATRIEQAFDERDSAEAQLRQFVADASHELRTPLTAIIGYADLHQAGALTAPGQTDRAMERIGSEALRLMKLVEDLLTLARLDQGRPLRLESFNVSTVVSEVIGDARTVAPGRQILAVVPDEIWVVADRDQLQQVLTNLVTNARDHTPPATVISIGGVQTPHDIRLTVSDDGPGFDPDTAERVFDRFWRGDVARSRNSGGAGLGLPIARSIVEAHGGELTLETNPAGGSTFRVCLPAALGGTGETSRTGPPPPEGPH